MRAQPMVSGRTRALVQVEGDGEKSHPAYDHKFLYDYRLLNNVFESAGFQVDLLEYCDEQGRFHYKQWNHSDGLIYRSLLVDQRNKDGVLGFVSLIIDAYKL